MSTKLTPAKPGTVTERQDDADIPTRAAVRPAAVDVPRRRGAAYFDTILWRLRSRADEVNGTGHLVGVTGCTRRSGTSTVAANMAIRAADHGMTPTLLVDANFRHPRQRQLMRTRKGPGLAEILAGRASVAEAVQATQAAGLSVLAPGSRDVIERSAFDQDRLEALLKELRHEYRFVVFDLSEADDLNHGLLFAHRLDAALLVIRAEGVRRRGAESTASRLVADGVNLVGTVVTGQKRYTPHWLRRWF